MTMPEGDDSTEERAWLKCSTYLPIAQQQQQQQQQVKQTNILNHSIYQSDKPRFALDTLCHTIYR